MVLLATAKINARPLIPLHGSDLHDVAPLVPAAVSQTPVKATTNTSSIFAAVPISIHLSQPVSARNSTHLVHNVVVAIRNQPNLAQEPRLLDAQHMTRHLRHIPRFRYPA